jgi:hypothetical protein
MSEPSVKVVGESAKHLRERQDRRKQPTPMFSRYTFLGGRRRTSRRVREQEGSFVDRFGSDEALMVLALLLFNSIDAVCTLFFIQEGAAVELNPVADWLMGLHSQAFIWVKTLGIGAVAAFLMVSKNFAAGRLGLRLVFWLYGALAHYHTVLLWIYFRM